MRSITLTCATDAQPDAPIVAIRSRTREARTTAAAPLSFTFCERHGVLVQRIGEGCAQVVHRAGAQLASVAEVRRVLGVPLQLRRVDSEAFDQLLRQQYEGGTNTAVQMASGILNGGYRVGRTAAGGR